MKNLKIITGKAAHYYLFEKDGQEIKIESRFIDADSKLNLETMQMCSIAEKELYKSLDWKTGEELERGGVLKGRSDLEEYRHSTGIYPEDYDGDLDIDAIIEDFKNHGYNVSREAILHNLQAWEQDFKSGYRGEDYFLFTPCGCNPLRFEACRLIDGCDWQYTYEA